MSLTGEYSINGKDLFTAFGFVISDSINGLLKFPDRKEPLSHDWADQNGEDTDLTTPVFKSKTIEIKGTLIAINTDDFWSKHQALFSEISQPGTLRFFSAALGRSFSLYFISCPDFTRLSTIRIGTQSRVGCKYTLNFIEPVPSFWAMFTYLADKDNNTFKTSDNKFIKIP